MIETVLRTAPALRDDASPLELMRSASAVEVAARIRRGDVSSRQMVDACIAEVERVNPMLNAVVATRFAEARAEADFADRRLAREGGASLPPLHGVPCTIKECFALVGMPQTSGLRARVVFRPREDAVAVSRLRDAGAIPVGVTNVPELCMWLESFNKVYGRTNNPYDPRRIPGGSSGGEGAIVGSGASLFGLGSDVAGSIRLPAYFNGVFGHKCSSGLIPNTGQYPQGDGAAGAFLSTGPIARRAEDLHLLVRLLAGTHESDPDTKPIPLRDPRSVDLSLLRVIDVPDDGRTFVSADLRRSQRLVANHLRAIGCRVREQRFGRLDRGFEIWSSIMHVSQGTPFASLLANGGTWRSLPELAKLAAGRSDHTLASVVLAVGERLTDLVPGHTRAMVEQGRLLRAELSDALAGDTVMLYPSYGVVAPRHDIAKLWPFQAAYTSVLSTMELPVTQVPLGLDRRGLPLGIQVVAAHGNDHLTLAVASELERAFGGWVRPARLSADSSRQTKGTAHA